VIARQNVAPPRKRVFVDSCKRYGQLKGRLKLRIEAIEALNALKKTVVSVLARLSPTLQPAITNRPTFGRARGRRVIRARMHGS
jgi:hypothetical protein